MTHPWARPLFLWVSLGCGALACAQGGYDVVLRAAEAGAGSREDGGAPLTWGEHAATLDVPACSSEAAALLVTTTGTELDGGETLADPSQAGPALSLVEALWIAANRPGSDTIVFDAAVFPAARPAMILLDSATRVPTNALVDTCIDARGRGVVVDWSGDRQAHATAIWNIGAGSLQIGLTLLRLPFEQVLTSGGQIAGCRVGTDGHDVALTARPWLLDVVGAGPVVGPGNVFAGDTALRLGGSGAMVRGNDFGVDPLTRRRLDLGSVAELNAAASFRGNVFATAFCLPGVGGGGATLHENFFGVDRDLQALPEPRVGALYLSDGRFALWRNTIHGAATAAVHIGAWATVTLSQNSITRNALGIVFDGDAPLPPPTVDELREGYIEGSCSHVDNHVEAFADAGDQGELYLGASQCNSGARWHVLHTAAAGLHITAIQTDPAGHSSAFSAPRVVP